MNLCALDSDPQKTAAAVIDSHVTPVMRHCARILGSVAADKASQDPWTAWARLSRYHAEWVYYVAFFLNSRFELYLSDREHPNFNVCWEAQSSFKRLGRSSMQAWPQVLPKEFQISVSGKEALSESHPTVQAYRRWYSVSFPGGSYEKLSVPPWMNSTSSPEPVAAVLSEAPEGFELEF